MLERLRSRLTSSPRELKVIVTGPPRSGTSFLCGLVHRMGYRLGPEEWLRQADVNNVHGYFECLPLLRISEEILSKFGGDFHLNIPDLPDNWPALVGREKKLIRSLVNKGRIDLYKGNRLLVLADLYDELYPKARWIFMNRNIEETFESRGGKGRNLTFEQWQSITDKRLQYWYASKPSRKALELDYNDFREDPVEAMSSIQSFLNIDLDETSLRELMGFFKPRVRR